MQKQPELLDRVQLAHLPVRHVWLARWGELRKQANKAGAAWPLSTSRAEVAREWKTIAAGRSSAPWTKVTL